METLKHDVYMFKNSKKIYLVIHHVTDFLNYNILFTIWVFITQVKILTI